MEWLIDSLLELRICPKRFIHLILGRSQWLWAKDYEKDKALLLKVNTYLNFIDFNLGD